MRGKQESFDVGMETLMQLSFESNRYLVSFGYDPRRELLVSDEGDSKRKEFTTAMVEGESIKDNEIVSRGYHRIKGC